LKFHIANFVCFVVLFVGGCFAETNQRSVDVFNQLSSDTWVAHDGLGRQLRGFPECGSLRKEKYVGIFYT